MVRAKREFPDARHEIRTNRELPEKQQGLRRRPDVAVIDKEAEPPKTVKIYEAGRTNQSGQAVSRERKKLGEYDTHGIPSEFHPVK